MRQYAPTILDITHSLQQPNQSSGVTGGRPELIETIAKAGIAVGADGIFIETHPNPAVAKSDGANMLKLDASGSFTGKTNKSTRSNFVKRIEIKYRKLSSGIFIKYY